MILFPAIDLFEKKAVRLYKGDYANMTIYSENPIEIARDFENSGCTHIHMVDLEGAKDGTTPNLSTPLLAAIGAYVAGVAGELAQAESNPYSTLPTDTIAALKRAVTQIYNAAF